MSAKDRRSGEASRRAKLLLDSETPRRRTVVKQCRREEKTPDLALCNQCDTVNERRQECVKCGNWVGESSRAATGPQIDTWKAAASKKGKKR